MWGPFHFKGAILAYQKLKYVLPSHIPFEKYICHIKILLSSLPACLSSLLLLVTQRIINIFTLRCGHVGGREEKGGRIAVDFFKAIAI